MKDVLDDIEQWQSAGHRVALARVVAVIGSGPRDPGAAMAVNDQGEVAGSVSGGCVEGAVVAEALEVLASGEPRLCTFGYSDEEAFSVGLTCGGHRPHLRGAAGLVDGLFALVRDCLRAEEPVALATVIDLAPRGRRRGRWSFLLWAPSSSCARSRADGLAGRARPRRRGRPRHPGALDGGHSVARHYGPHGEAGRTDVTVFIEVFAPPPRMLIFGAVDFTAALVRVAKVLGYHVTVCDARPVFATSARFPEADEVVADWPHRHLAKVADRLGPGDAICVLTHDHKFDIPALIGALETKVGYIGAMGSRSTHNGRVERLRAEGVEADDIARIMAPIGIDIGARTPEETAVSICAEIISLRAGVKAPSLRDGAGPIHRVAS